MSEVVRTAHVVMHQPEYEPGRILMVCEDADDADVFATQTRDADTVVVPAMFVPAGGTAQVYQQQVWTLTVSVEPGGDGLWYPGAVHQRSELEWRAEDPPADATVNMLSRTAASRAAAPRADKYVVRATGPTSHTAHAALQEKLDLLLSQLEDGKLS